jgi:hypothetical protein
MLPAERRSVAKRVVDHLATIAPEFGPTAFGPIIASRVGTVLTAIDAAASAADSPLLIVELLPGLDVIVARDFSQPAPRPAADAPSLESVWDKDPVSCEWLDALTDSVEGVIGAAGNPGAWHHQGGDGLHYFVFDARYRAQALAQLGIEEGDVQMAMPKAEALLS